MPSTIRRSSSQAQDAWAKAHDSAVEKYGEGERAVRTALSALKNKFEEVGDRWQNKRGGTKVRSGAQARKRTPRAGRRPAKTAEGVDAGASKDHLYQVAKDLGIEGRSSMTKNELVTAIKKANRRKTAQSRKK